MYFAEPYDFLDAVRGNVVELIAEKDLVKRAALLQRILDDVDQLDLQIEDLKGDVMKLKENRKKTE